MSSKPLPIAEHEEESLFSQIAMSYVLPVVRKGEELTINDYVPLRGVKNVEDLWIGFWDIWEEMAGKGEEGEGGRREEKEKERSEGESERWNEMKESFEEEREGDEEGGSFLSDKEEAGIEEKNLKTKEKDDMEKEESKDTDEQEAPLLSNSTHSPPSSSPSSLPSPSLFRAISLFILPTLSFAFLYRFLSILFNVLRLLAMREYFSYLFQDDKTVLGGLLLCLLLSGSSLLSGCLLEHSRRVCNEAANNARCVCVCVCVCVSICLCICECLCVWPIQRH